MDDKKSFDRVIDGSGGFTSRWCLYFGWFAILMPVLVCYNALGL